MKTKNSLARLRVDELKMGYLFLMPAVIFILIFIFASIIYSFYMSFFDWELFDLGKDKVFVGLANYLRMFDDEVFGISLKNTLVIVIVCLLSETTLGFLIALTLSTINRKMRIVQSIILLPMITSPVIVGLIWRYIYDPQFGILNYFLKNTLGIADLAWLGNSSLSLTSVMIVDIWQMTPFVVLVLYAAMMGMSESRIEAARVDGATFWQIVRFVVLPSITPMIAFVMLIRSMDLFKIFDTIYVMTKGGPGYSTETLALYTYKTAFSHYNMGYAMSLSIITLVCIASISLIYIKSRKTSN